MSATSSRGRASLAFLLPTLFACFLMLPTMDWWFHLDRTVAPNEKRQLAQMPEYRGLLQTKDFIFGLENYFNDHFGFRKRLIRTSNHWKQQMFAEAGHDVTIGRDGWLYYGGRMIETYTGIATFKDQELKDWQTLLETRRDWLAQRGIQYLFVIPPDKHSIYPEHLPSWLVKSKNPLKLDQFLEYMRVHSTVKVLDLRPSLVEAKKVMPTYLMTDTHWNQFGGFIGYQSLINTLSNVFPDLAPLPLSAVEIKAFEDNPGGDLALMLGDNHLREHCNVSLIPRPPLPILTPSDATSRMPKKWRKDFGPVLTLNPNALRKAVVFRDSFALCLYGFLGQHFNEVLYIWQAEWDYPFLEREKPAVVIDEILERSFNSTDPKKLMELDLLSSNTNNSVKL